jgi:5-carboxymethyl-2-hydroxymuconate isomerase
MRAPGPRIETLDAALDHYDLATANGADLVAPDTFERAIDLASWALADGEHDQGAVMLTMLIGAPVGDALAHRFAAALRDARRAHAEHPSGGGRADAAQSL